MAENTPEKIAFDLMGKIADAEGKFFAGADKNTNREWILRTYAQCLQTITGPKFVHQHLETFTG